MYTFSDLINKIPFGKELSQSNEAVSAGTRLYFGTKYWSPYHISSHTRSWLYACYTDTASLCTNIV